jgi:hypothetical protein
MTTPVVTETPLSLARTERDDFADERPRRPRLAPYHRPSQAELVRQSLDSELCAHTYDHRSES